MVRGRVSRALFSISIAVGIAVAAMPAQAGSTGNGTAGNGLPQFKTLPLYSHEEDAQRLCKGDTVVWGSSANIGIYYIKGAGPQRIGGYYACMADAKKAGYKIGE